MSMGKIFLISITLMFLASCGVHKVEMTIAGKELREKTFNTSCGEIFLKAKQSQGDFLIDINLALEDTIYLYGDSLETKLNEKTVKHSFQTRKDTLIGERELGFFIWSGGRNWTTGKDTLSINFDGMLYCQDRKLMLNKVLIIE